MDINIVRAGCSQEKQGNIMCMCTSRNCKCMALKKWQIIVFVIHIPFAAVIFVKKMAWLVSSRPFWSV